MVTDVSKFMELLLNDCSGEAVDDGSDVPPDPDEMSFLALRVWKDIPTLNNNNHTYDISHQCV